MSACNSQPWLHFYSFGDTSPDYNLSAHLADSRVQDPFILKSKQLPRIYSFIPRRACGAQWGAVQDEVHPVRCASSQGSASQRQGCGADKERGLVLLSIFPSADKSHALSPVFHGREQMEMKSMTNSLQLRELHLHLQS